MIAARFDCADILGVVITCVQALRRGPYALWKDTITSTRLAQLGPSFQPKQRRRKKDTTNGTEHEEAA